MLEKEVAGKGVLQGVLNCVKSGEANARFVTPVSHCAAAVRSDWRDALGSPI